MKTLEFPYSSFARKPHSNPSGEQLLQRAERNMTKPTADLISFDFTSIPSNALDGADGKVQLNVEEGDDYNSEEEICDSPRSFKRDTYITSPLRQPEFDSSNMNGKRPADDEGAIDGAPDDAKRPRLTTPGLTKALTLPENIWIDIFSRLPPQKLAQLRRTCRLFQKYLLNQSIWRASRKQWMPDMPKPVFNLKEWEMLALTRGDGCMICGNKTYTRAIYWAFRVRCCTQCFNQNMTKETSLSDTKFPTALLTALPFGFIDASGQWVPNAMGQCSGGGLTKVYWNADLKSIKERFAEAKAMNAEEEWLKGLESEGIENKLDVIRMESFESRWLARGKGKPGANFPKSQGACISNYAAKGNAMRPNWQQFQTSQSPTHLHTPLQAHQFAPQIHTGMMNLSFPPRQHVLNTPPIFQGQPSPLIPGDSWAGGYINGQPSIPMLQPKHRASAARTERSLTEAVEVRARRQQEIEARCLRLDPPLLPNVLQHIPAFKASIMIAMPLNEQAWEKLLPKLLEQREEAEGKERVKMEGQIKLEKQIEEKKAHDTLQRELKEKKEREWDEVQAPVKAKLDQYATEIINHWLARIPVNQHPSKSKESALRFAPEVLVQVRKRFYDENPYTQRDPNHLHMLDPNSPQGAAILETPSGERLMLENMKYVFDTKIKPITDQVRKELFLCSGCENNHKFYGFEGVIQHYAAKHTNLLSLGSVIVHWKTDWPHCPPFVLDPAAAASNMKQKAHATLHQQFKINSHPSINPAFGSYNTTHQMGMHMSAQMEISHQTMITDGYQNDEAYMNGVYTAFPTSQQQYAPQQHNGSVMQTININAPIQTMVPTSFAPYQQQSETQRVQLEEIAVTGREAWFQLNGIKDLPSSVRVYYVIQKVVKAFHAKFPPLLPQLNMFIEALREHNLMKPMRNVNGLQCLACTINPPPPNTAGVSVHHLGRVFTLISLIQHFEMVHVVRNRSQIKMDWKTQMIRLPEARVIGMLRDAMGMDEEKLRLLKEVFPVAFNLPLPMRNTGGFVPSPGPFPKSTQTLTPSSSIAASSPSPLRTIGTKETSPASEPSQTPKSMVESPTYIAQKFMKSEVSLGTETRTKPSPVVKKEARRCTPEPRPPKRALIHAAEQFLETFLQDKDRRNHSSEIASEREFLEPVPERKKRRLEDEGRNGSGIQPLLRPITPRSESPLSPIRSKWDSVEGHSLAIDPYCRQRSPLIEEGRSSRKYRPSSPSESRYCSLDDHSDYLPPRSPRPRSPRRGRIDTNVSEERGRVLHARPYSPHSRSRSPMLRYLPPHPVDLYRDREYRVELYPRDPLLYPREYTSEGYGYGERGRSSVAPVSRHAVIPADPRYYDAIYDNDRYIDEIIVPTRVISERSRSPASELSLRSQAIPRDYKYNYAPPAAHHLAPYYAYPSQAVPPPPYPRYLEESRYARETRSRSPIYGIEPIRTPSNSSRHQIGAYHAHTSSSSNPKEEELYADEEEYHPGRWYREKDTGTATRIYTDHPDHHFHALRKYDDISTPRE